MLLINIGPRCQQTLPTFSLKYNCLTEDFNRKGNIYKKKNAKLLLEYYFIFLSKNIYTLASKLFYTLKNKNEVWTLTFLRNSSKSNLFNLWESAGLSLPVTDKGENTHLSIESGNLNLQNFSQFKYQSLSISVWLQINQYVKSAGKKYRVRGDRL